jgi:hypothetical protein
LRGGKITSIAINYKDWYESFKQNSIDYQAQIKMQKEAEVRRIDEAMKQLELEQKTKMMQEAYDKAQKENLSEENIFIPDDLIFDVSEKETVNNEDGVGYESTVNINEDVLVVDENLPLLTGETKDISADLDVIKENEIADKELNNIVKKEELEKTIESLSEVLPEEVTKALEVMKKNDGNNLELKI